MSLVIGPPDTKVARRTALLASGRGYITEAPVNNGATSGATALTSGTIYFTAIGLLAGDVVSNISTLMTVNGSTLTLTKVGLYDASGTRLASSADASTSFASGAAKIVTIALSSAYTVPSDGLYYAAVVCVGTTPPTLSRGQASLSDNALSGSRLMFGRQTSQTDLIASATIGTGGPCFWVGIT